MSRAIVQCHMTALNTFGTHRIQGREILTQPDCRQDSGQVGGIEVRDLDINLEEFLPYGPFLPEPDPVYRDVPVFREGEEERIP